MALNIAPLTPSNTLTETRTKVEVKNLSVYYGKFRALTDINLQIYANKITAIIGPSGCGKSTLLRTFNRMTDLTASAHTEGQISLDGESILETGVDVVDVRRRVGMVFQRPNPFPKSIYDNVTYGPRLYGVRGKTDLDQIVEKSLRQAALWDEVKDKLNQSGIALSGGQQQRLCIARALAVEPEIILMDEPASALDPISTLKIEELMHDIVKDYTIIIVTHNMQQAARISDNTAFFYLGELIEYDRTKKIFTNPDKRQTEDYISGRFG